MSGETRHVRVTIEGQLSRATKRRSVLRFSGGAVVLKDGLEDVTVETVTIPRVWTDGDVVLVESIRESLPHLLAWARMGGRWRTVGVTEAYDDGDMDQALDDERATVLRQQVAS